MNYVLWLSGCLHLSKKTKNYEKSLKFIYEVVQVTHQLIVTLVLLWVATHFLKLVLWWGLDSQVLMQGCPAKPQTLFALVLLTLALFLWTTQAQTPSQTIWSLWVSTFLLFVRQTLLPQAFANLKSQMLWWKKVHHDLPFSWSFLSLSRCLSPNLWLVLVSILCAWATDSFSDQKRIQKKKKKRWIVYRRMKNLPFYFSH